MRRPSNGIATRAGVAALLLLGGLLIGPSSAQDSTSARETFGSKTAAAKYGWRPALFDFEWEYGEALTDPPGRGSKLVGSWIDYSTGSGAAAQHNGGVLLQSKYGRLFPQDAGPGDFGTTSITLTGNPQTYGRWEVRIRPWVIENTGKDYRVKFELIPVNPGRHLCGARSITVVDLTPRKNEVRIAAYSPLGQKAWRATRGTATIERLSRSYAVEVTKDHISWFMDGAIIGTVKAPAAIPRYPLTMRVSLVGDGQAEMNHTYVMMDWLRGYTLKRGLRPANGAKLAAGSHNLHC